MFQAPLLDVSVGEERLGEWIDANTMRCHAKLLPLLASARRGDASGGPAWVLDDAYQAVLDATPLEADDESSGVRGGVRSHFALALQLVYA